MKLRWRFGDKVRCPHPIKMSTPRGRGQVGSPDIGNEELSVLRSAFFFIIFLRKKDSSLYPIYKLMKTNYRAIEMISITSGHKKKVGNDHLLDGYHLHPVRQSGVPALPRLHEGGHVAPRSPKTLACQPPKRLRLPCRPQSGSRPHLQAHLLRCKEQGQTERCSAGLGN